MSSVSDHCGQLVSHMTGHMGRTINSNLTPSVQHSTTNAFAASG